MSKPAELELFDPSTDADAAFFLPESELRKNYTAGQVNAVSWKRNLICMCIASGWPIEDIARAAHVSTRTVLALAGRESEQVAGKIKEFGQALHTLGARWYGLARAKEGEATFIQLAQAASFAVQRGSEVMAAAGTGEDAPEEVFQSESGPSAAGKLSAWLGGAASAVESESTANTTKPAQNNAFPALRYTGDTDSSADQARAAAVEVVEPARSEEAGGGVGSGSAVKIAMGQQESGISANASPVPAHEPLPAKAVIAQILEKGAPSEA